MGSSWLRAPKIWALANAMPAQEACRGLQAVSTLARQGAGGCMAGWEGELVIVSHLYSVLHVERNTWALGWPQSDSGWALHPPQQPQRPAQGLHGKQLAYCTGHNFPTRGSFVANPLMPRLPSTCRTRTSGRATKTRPVQAAQAARDPAGG
jgi:hypothetical protein